MLGARSSILDPLAAVFRALTGALRMDDLEDACGIIRFISVPES